MVHNLDRVSSRTLGYLELVLLDLAKLVDLRCYGLSQVVLTEPFQLVEVLVGNSAQQVFVMVQKHGFHCAPPEKELGLAAKGHLQCVVPEVVVVAQIQREIKLWEVLCLL